MKCCWIIVTCKFFHFNFARKENLKYLNLNCLWFLFPNKLKRLLICLQTNHATRISYHFFSLKFWCLRCDKGFLYLTFAIHEIYFVSQLKTLDYIRRFSVFACVSIPSAFDEWWTFIELSKVSKNYINIIEKKLIKMKTYEGLRKEVEFKEKTRIEWAPLSVPLHRRIETFSAFTFIFIVLFAEIITFLIFLEFFVSRLLKLLKSLVKKCLFVISIMAV